MAQQLCHKLKLDANDVLPSGCTGESQRNLLIIANEHNWDVRPINVKTAYLESKKRQEVYVHQPHGYKKINSKSGKLYIWRLKHYRSSQTVENCAVSPSAKACIN